MHHDGYMAIPGTYRLSDETAVADDVAIPAWAAAARPALLDVARRYRATITYKELSEAVQFQSGVATRRLIQHWIGRVLGSVAAACHAAGEPLLSSLCVNAEGSVGPGYNVAILETYGPPEPEDADRHAAEERLKCYVCFGATLPPGGGVPALTPKLAQQRVRARQLAMASRPREVCPVCFQQKSATGACACF